MALNEEIGKTKEYIKIGSDFKAGNTFDRSDGNINTVTGADQTTVDQRKGNLVKGTELYNSKNSTSIPVASPGAVEPDEQKRCYIIVDKCKIKKVGNYDPNTTILFSNQFENTHLSKEALSNKQSLILIQWNKTTEEINFNYYSWKWNDQTHEPFYKITFDGKSCSVVSSIFYTADNYSPDKYYDHFPGLLKYISSTKSFETVTVPAIYQNYRKIVVRSTFTVSNTSMPTIVDNITSGYLIFNQREIVYNNKVPEENKKIYYRLRTDTVGDMFYENSGQTESNTLFWSINNNRIVGRESYDSIWYTGTDNNAGYIVSDVISDINVSSNVYSNIEHSNFQVASFDYTGNNFWLMYVIDNYICFVKIPLHHTQWSSYKADYEGYLNENITLTKNISRIAICEEENKGLIVYLLLQDSSLYRLSLLK